MADREIQPAPCGLKLAFGNTLVSTKLMDIEQDKSRAVYKLCHTKIKPRCIMIVGPKISIELNCQVPSDSHPCYIQSNSNICKHVYSSSRGVYCEAQ